MFARISSRDNDKAGKAPAVKKNGHDTLAPQQVVPLDEDLDEELSSRLSPVHTDLKMHLHQRLLDMINLSVIDKMPPEVFRKEIGEIVRELLIEENKPLNLAEQARLVDDILDEVVGLGPLEPLLKDNSVTDILVNTGICRSWIIKNLS